MDFDISPKQRQMLDRVVAFMDEHVYPAIPVYEAQMSGADRWIVVPVVEELKKKAKAAGLWNFFMPPHSGQVHVDDTFQFEGQRAVIFSTGSPPPEAALRHLIALALTYHRAKA